jgi:C_GCAxxG_C_C family probable redox protein
MLLSAREAMDIDCEFFPQVASALGAGLCYQGEVCGIALGALLTIGLKYGRRKDGDSNDITYYLGSEFIDRFRQIQGTIKCRDFTNADFNTPEGEQAWIERIQDETCSPLMEKAVIILNELLDEATISKCSR